MGAKQMKEPPILYRKFISFLVGTDIDRADAEQRIPREFRMNKKDVRETILELERMGYIKKTLVKR